jgi:hypothetical protein
MRFFKIVGVALGAIALFNLMQIAVELSMRQGVYACSEVTKSDPLDVQKLCRGKTK